ncbi:MAG TPA: dockerin type I domain-containing protein, partial [Pirellulaceae bacterium]|nr:dockerin type I domain-containing protein [Pirellulaceae bacterium]
MRVEPLETRDLLAALWRNPVDSLDVDGDGLLAAIDALQIVNRLNGGGEVGTRSTALPATRSDNEPYVDVDGDGAVTPSDALLVVESLNQGHVGTRSLKLRVGNQGATTPPDDSTGRSAQAESTFVIAIGQSAGVRHVRLAIETEWATPDALLEVRLVDPGPDYPGRSLLDGDRYAAPLLRLQPSNAGTLAAEHPLGFTRWDGRVLELALPDFQGHGSALLSVRLAAGASDGTGMGGGLAGTGGGGVSDGAGQTGGGAATEGTE